MPRAGEGCGSSVGHEEPRNSRELPASRHRAHSEGQAETWPLSEILSREDKGENSSDDVELEDGPSSLQSPRAGRLRVL